MDAEWQNHWLSPLDPVAVLHAGASLVVELRLPIELVNDEFVWTLQPEDGPPCSGGLLPVDGEMVGVAHFDDSEYQAYRLTLPVTPPLGYHRLSLGRHGIAESLASMRIIVSPGSCYQPAA